MFMQKHELLYLSRRDVERTKLPMEKIINLVEEAFREKGEGRVEVPPKPGIHPQENSFIHAMPALLSRVKAAGVKWISGFLENPAKGLPYMTGLIILNDFNTGLPMCVMDASWVTAMRTGAATAVTAKYLARKDSRTLGILGCGVQGRSNLEALAVGLNELKEVKAYDANAENLKKYVEEMTERFRLKIRPVNSPREALEGCDIVVTAGPMLKHRNPVIEAEWFKDGGLACPLDYDSYWKLEAMRSMDKFCTDDREQLVYTKSIGRLQYIPEIHADLSEIIGGKKPGREDEMERIMSMNLGVAINDMAVAIEIYQVANKKHLGTWLPL